MLVLGCLSCSHTQWELTEHDDVSSLDKDEGMKLLQVLVLRGAAVTSTAELETHDRLRTTSIVTQTCALMHQTTSPSRYQLYVVMQGLQS